MKKILSLLLAITLIFGVLPMSAFADEPNAEPKTDIIDIIDDTVDDPVEDQTDPVEDPTKDPTEDQTDDPTDNPTNTINATNGGGMILVDSGDGCTCDSFCDDPDCVVCKDDHTQCFHYICICEAVCAEGEANTACPVCKDDYSKCVQAVEVPKFAPMSPQSDAADALAIALNAIQGSSAAVDVGDNTKVNVTGTIALTTGTTISVPSGVTLDIVSGGSITVNHNAAAGLIIQDGGTLVVSGGTVTTSVVSAVVGGIVINSGGAMNVSGGTVALTNPDSTGIVVNTGGELNVTNGTVTVSHLGGIGIKLNGAMTVSSNGAVNVNNTVSGTIGIDVTAGTMTVSSNGTVTVNTNANASTKGISVSGGALNVSSGTVNVANSGSARGIDLTSGTMTVNSGTVNVTNSSSMGGVFINSGASMNIRGGAVNVSNSAGAGIYVDGPLTFSGGAVNVNNTVTSYGIAVSGGPFTLDASTKDVTLTLNGNNRALEGTNIVGNNAATHTAKIVTGNSTTPPTTPIFYSSPTAAAAGAVANTDYEWATVGASYGWVVETTPPPPAPPAPSSGGSSSKKEKPAPAPSPWLDPTPAQNMSSDAKHKDSDLVRTKSSDLYGVRKDAWQKLKGYRFVHDTMDGDTVGVRVSINEPEKIKQDLLVSGYVKGASANSRKAQFEKWFNNKIHVIHFDQTGAWGQPVEIAAKIDPNQFDSLNNLFFYSYDSTTGKYTRIERQSNHWLDKKGYLHFTTELAGDIIISEGPLEKK